MMRSSLILLCVAFFIFFCTAFTSLNATEPGSNIGYFGGELSAYASGDTIMYVYYNAEQDAAEEAHYVKFRISVDGGNSWQEYTVGNDPVERLRPTLTVVDDYILVHMGQIYRSDDLGQNWEIWDQSIEHQGSNAESTPYVFKHEEDFASFKIQLPYPEWQQYDFTVNGTDDPLFRPYSSFAFENKTPHGTDAYWFGIDELDGIMRTNSDLHIRQAGGGENGGWPRFNAPVVIGGEVVSIPPNYPVDQVFPAGLFENYNMPVFPAINPARQSGIHLGDGDAVNNIYLIEVDGANYSGWRGSISLPYGVNINVYDSYPPAGDSLFVNNFSIRDTLWTVLAGGQCSNREFFVDGELWIKGEFSGEQTWTASGKIKIIGDITLTNTNPGDDPLDNNSDVVTLLSEESIELKYGYKNPADSMRIHPLCGPDSEPHYIYANLYAIGDNSNDPFNGLFTFEYQHPHPSTPAVSLPVEQTDGSVVDTVFEWIDLHRRHYPPTGAHPWPSPALEQTRLDLPWYNPLWPEAEPYLERGTIEVWGNVTQRKRGFLHRSTNDSEYPSHTGVWDLPLDKCGYPTNPVLIPDPVFGDSLGLMSRNFPGAAGSGVGYKRSYHADLRHQFYREPGAFYNRLWKFGFIVSKPTIEPRIFQTIGSASIIKAIQSKSMDARNGYYAYAVNDALLYDDGMNPAVDLSDLTRDQGLILNVQLNSEQHPVVHQHRKMDTGEAFTVITEIDPITTPQIVSSFSYPSAAQRMPEAFCIMPDGRMTLARCEQSVLILSEIMADGSLEEIQNWVLAGETNLANSRLHMKAADDNTLDLFLWVDTSQMIVNGWGEIIHLRSQLPVSITENTVPEINQTHLTAYPNPARNSLSIELKLPGHNEHTLEIFNIRGQKVKSYRAKGSKSPDSLDYEWDLKDERLNPVARGVYILRLKIDGKEAVSRRITVN